MTVKELVVAVANMLELSEVNTYFESESGTAPEAVSLLIKIINMCLDSIVTEYFPIKKIATINSDDGIIPFSDIDEDLIDIYKVESHGVKTLYRCLNDHIKTVSGSVDITYSIRLKEKTILDSITELSPRVSLRILSYGVASDYCLMTGRMEDSAMYEERYNTALKIVSRKKGEVYIRPRRWC